MIGIAQIGDVVIRQERSTGATIFIAGMRIDADGSPHAYHPDNVSGLDDLTNAGKPGQWWGLACDHEGEPYVQRAGDPAPGFYVSQTALEYRQFNEEDPRRYVDSEQIPYIVLPRGYPCKPQLGCDVSVVNLRNKKFSHAIYGDVGPADQIGEGSIALAKALGINPDARTGGIANGILYIVHA